MMLRGRQTEAVDPSRSVCVVAGAGTGKTHILIAKYIDLLERGYSPNDILAMTFTRKAASEMRERVEVELEKRVLESPSRWRYIMDEFVWADISTFHSFCLKVLHEFPIEANVDPDFIIIDELQAKRLLEEALDACIHSPSRKSYKSICRLLCDTDEWHVKGYLRELYKNRLFTEEFFKGLDKDDREIIEIWKSQFCEFQRDLFNILKSNRELRDIINELHRHASTCKKDKDAAMKYLRSIEPYLVELIERRSPDAFLFALNELSGIKGRVNMGSSANWKPEDLKSVRDSYVRLQLFFTANKPLLEIQPGDESFLKYALIFLRDLREAFREYLKNADDLKRKIGGIDFNDMIYAAYRLFRDHRDLAQGHFHDRYRYILVDEFQDTDPIQCKIIWTILGNLDEASDRLFIVGDPKQSIYLFRDADVALFKEMQEIIHKGLKGKIVPLDINFRSAPEIVYFVNYLFSQILSSSSKPWEFGYDPLEVSCERINDHGSVELLLAPSARWSQERAKKEAEMMARRIQNIIEIEKREIYWDKCKNKLSSPRPAQYSDVAILLQRRTNLHYIEWALQKYGIPYHVSSGLGFYERQEIIDLFNLLKFLDNELDDIALYGILRSPYFGISDASLYKITKSGIGSLWSRIRMDIRQNEGAAVMEAVSLLEDWLSRAHLVPVTDLLHRIIESSKIYAVYGGLVEGDRIIANLEKFLQIARDAQKQGMTSITDFVSDLELLIEEVPMEGEGQIDAENENATKIMTVHASKGLEFPIVVIPEMASKGGRDHPTLMVDETLGIGLRVSDPTNEYKLRDTFQLQILKARQDEKSEAERKRLFYVAATRAKDHLILCGSIIDGCVPSIEEGSTWLDWTYACLNINDEHIRSGTVSFQWPNGSPNITAIPIIDDPEDIPAETRERIPELIEVDKLYLSKAESSEILHPVQVPEQEHIFSASEIEDYKLCPKKYSDKYITGIPNKHPLISDAEENGSIQGLIIHEIFQGKDATRVLKRYGISDANRERSYKKIYERFLLSDIMKNVTEEYKELPFLARIDGTLFSGTIDRLIKKDDGSWNIIDYKTSKIYDDQIEKELGKYTSQLAIYRKAMQKILGKDICAFVYFTSAEKTCSASADEAKVLSNINRIVKKIRLKEVSFECCERCERQNNDKLDGLCPALENEIDVAF
jgi:ATP-dependent helicase/nuclease subunit A